MTTTDAQERKQRTQDVTGDLADSARRHLAYESLRRQAEVSERAVRLALAAITRRRCEEHTDAEEETHERDERP